MALTLENYLDHTVFQSLCFNYRRNYYEAPGRFWICIESSWSILQTRTSA